MQKLSPENHSYNSSLACHFEGELDIEILKKVLQEIVDRHSSLRTTFATTDGKTVSCIAQHMYLPCSIKDISSFDEVARNHAYKQFVEDASWRGFDLETESLIRTQVIKLSLRHHVLLITLHQIVADEWSMGVLMRELATLYQAAVTNTPASLPELSIQYADFAVWQRHFLQGKVLQDHLDYWTQQLPDPLPVLHLPTDRPRPAIQRFQGAVHSFHLSPELSQQLKDLSQQEGVTLFMTLLAAWGCLLSRYSGQQDFLLGTPIAGRTQSQLEPLIGFFVNTLVMRLDLRGEPDFRELVARVREMALGAYAHQDLPFEKLVEHLHPQRDLSRNPLFQVMFVLQDGPLLMPDVAHVELRAEELDTGAAKFDLTLRLQQDSQGWYGRLEYNTDLFEAATIERMQENWQCLLHGIVAHPDQAISTLPLLTAAQWQQVVVEWNETAHSYEQERSLSHWFERQVQQTPEAVALVFEEQEMSYRQLNERANQLAHYLQELGVGPEVLVGICMERSCEMIVSLVAILKAGGAYVPLDPSYPPERLAYMMQDSQAAVLLTQQRVREQVPTGPGNVLCVDSEWDVVARQSKENVPTRLRPENLAYVIYTSGSTGRPKGVAIEHKQLLNYIQGIIERFDLEPGATYALLQSLTADFCNTIIFPALYTGGSLHI
ncbi:MAG: AMP-binding protein, partial [Chloroflexi bacterium]|nr:AMP-binding protein [Chloroflexota bacterium]